jgi:hypothetical protein
MFVRDSLESETDVRNIPAKRAAPSQNVEWGSPAKRIAPSSNTNSSAFVWDSPAKRVAPSQSANPSAFVRDGFGDDSDTPVQQRSTVLPASSSLVGLEDTAPRLLLQHSCSSASELAAMLSADRTEFAICGGDYPLLLSACQFSYQQADKAFALSTSVKDTADWQFWSKYCAHMKTSPWRTDEAASPHGSRLSYLREVVLLTFALGYAMRHKVPRSKSDAMIRPATAMAFLRSVQRVHRRNHLSLIPLKALALPLKGLMRDFVLRFGPRSLLPKRREPFTNPMIATMLGVSSGVKLGRRVLVWDSLFGCSLAAAIELGAESGFRKAEMFSGNEETDFLHWSSFSLLIGDQWCAAQGSDRALWVRFALEGGCLAIIPPRSKADQFGEVWGNLPCYRKYRAWGRSAARRVCELALATLDAGRDLVGPVFKDDDGAVLKATVMTSVLFYLLCTFLPAEVAKLYTWHSFRIHLACALLKAGCSNGQIQAFLRWQSEESLRAYARMSVEQQLTLVSKAQVANVAVVQTNNLPIFEKFELFLAMQEMADEVNAESQTQ